MNRIHSLSLLGLFFSLSATAEPSSYWLKGPCGEDVKKHCAKAEAGEVMQCLRKHEGEWSPSCREKFAEKRGQKPAEEKK